MKSEDRKLLELAARAAGYNYSTEYGCCFDDEYPQGYEWNPLTDDGDALRLAVELNMVVRAFKHISDAQPLGCQHGVTEMNDNKDPYATTRRSIVRAAAEIGRQK